MRGWMESGPDAGHDGVVRWRVRDIRRKIEGAFGAVSADGSVRRLLRREGFRFVSGCPEHPRGTRARSVFGEGGVSRPVEVGSQPGPHEERLWLLGPHGG